jgi:hypothetical protein
MIPEVRTGVKENLSENFRDSLGPRSTAIDYRRCGPAGPAIMAPSAAATNNRIPIYRNEGAISGVQLPEELI